jgi:hypothetical protein
VAEPSNTPTPEEKQPSQHKKGRPAQGKRSNSEWVARTYYVRRDTDLAVELEMLKLKSEGVELDKSDIVDAALQAWLGIQRGESVEEAIARLRRKEE